VFPRSFLLSALRPLLYMNWDQVNWLDHYAVKLPIHGAACGVIAGDITASVNDCKYVNYVLGTWLTTVRVGR
jgi:hypothetical protein